MFACLHLTAADIRRVPWRNGRGTTEELCLAPPDGDFASGRFDWRLALAAVVEAGPFSAFPGFERVLVVVAGAGLRLDHGGAAPPVELAPLQAYRFAGEWSTRAELVSGPVTDLNLLLRREAVRGGLELVSPDRSVACRRLTVGEEVFVHALEGPLEVGVGASGEAATTPSAAPAGERIGCWSLAPRESLHLSGASGRETIGLRALDAGRTTRCVAAVVRIGRCRETPA